jgi:hypothetical protein
LYFLMKFLQWRPLFSAVYECKKSVVIALPKCVLCHLAKSKQYAPLFNVWVLPGTFPSYKFTLKTDGLTFYSLNVGSSNPNHPAQAVGAIHIG